MKKLIKITALMTALCLILCSCGAPKETPAYSVGLTDGGYYEGVKALDYVTLPDYSSIEIDPAELKEGVEYYLSLYAPAEQITDRAVEDGDAVNIDYVGYMDGEAFEGGSTGGNGTTVVIGRTSYIDDFLEQLIGHKPGETFDVNVTFPEPYENNPDLAGKDATFVTTVNYIEGETKTEGLDDAYVAANYTSQGWTSVKDIEDFCKANYAANTVFSEAEVSEVPEAVHAHTADLMIRNFTAQAENYGMELGEFLSSYYGVESEEAFREQYSDYIDSQAETAMIYQAVAEQEGLKISKADLRDYFKENFGNSYYTDYKNEYGLGYLCYVALHDKVEKLLAGKVL